MPARQTPLRLAPRGQLGADTREQVGAPLPGRQHLAGSQAAGSGACAELLREEHLRPGGALSTRAPWGHGHSQAPWLGQGAALNRRRRPCDNDGNGARLGARTPGAMQLLQLPQRPDRCCRAG